LSHTFASGIARHPLGRVSHDRNSSRLVALRGNRFHQHDVVAEDSSSLDEGGVDAWCGNRLYVHDAGCCL
jgi:hypothetical protein